jgi:glycosyltransferase involved in cell wall biosynthesis
MLLIVQQIIPAFRISLFREISKKAKIPVIVAAGKAQKFNARNSILKDDKIKIHQVSNFFILKNFLIYQKGVMDLLSKNQFECVIAEFNIRIISNYFILWYCRKNRIKFIWWGHGFGPRSVGVIKWLRLKLINLADGLLLYDYNSAKRFIDLGVIEEKIFVAPNSINVNLIKNYRKQLDPKDRQYILYIGRLIPKKRVDLLLKSFAKIKNQIHYDLLIIGNGPELEKLKEFSRSNNLSDRVLFLGEIVDENELSKYFNNSIMSISPGYIGLSAIHSLAYGVPLVVSRDEPHSPEIVIFNDGHNGQFFKTNSVTNLSSVILELINNHTLLERMSQNGINDVEHRFSINYMVDGFMKAIQIK